MCGTMAGWSDQVVSSCGQKLGRLTYIKSATGRTSLSVTCLKHGAGCKFCIDMEKGPNERGVLAWMQLAISRPGLTLASHRAHFDGLAFS